MKNSIFNYADGWAKKYFAFCWMLGGWDTHSIIITNRL